MLLASATAHGAPALVWMAPFILILACVAILPLIHSTHHWWEKNSNKLLVSGILGAPVLWYLLSHEMGDALHHSMVEYVQFIALLASLYYISGGILLRGDLEATPKVNAMFLGLGALMASFIGTTGASMLLIRPLLQTNAERKKVVHTVIFFIFMVSNIGGCLTPLGDPPLFLGFLRGVAFDWTFNLWKEWALLNAILLVVYYLWDSFAWRHEKARDIARDHTQITPLSIKGSINFLLLGGVVFAVAGSTLFSQHLSEAFLIPAGVVGEAKDAYMAHHPELFGGSPWREILMLLMVLFSRKWTAKGLRAENKFTLGPIGEVACLFIGIFITMIPTLLILKQNGNEIFNWTLGFFNATLTDDRAVALAPALFYWMTGLLSSFLDNAPTYLVFFDLAANINFPEIVNEQVRIAGVPERILTGISLGAVFMGANTYIGNGPNFMVKAVAEEAGIKMPSFFGYMAYSCCILMPLFALVTWLFLI